MYVGSRSPTRRPRAARRTAPVLGFSRAPRPGPDRSSRSDEPNFTQQNSRSRPSSRRPTSVGRAVVRVASPWVTRPGPDDELLSSSVAPLRDSLVAGRRNGLILHRHAREVCPGAAGPPTKLAGWPGQDRDPGTQPGSCDACSIHLDTSSSSRSSSSWMLRARASGSLKATGGRGSRDAPRKKVTFT